MHTRPHAPTRGRKLSLPGWRVEAGKQTEGYAGSHAVVPQFLGCQLGPFPHHWSVWTDFGLHLLAHIKVIHFHREEAWNSALRTAALSPRKRAHYSPPLLLWMNVRHTCLLHLLYVLKQVCISYFKVCYILISRQGSPVIWIFITQSPWGYKFGEWSKRHWPMK